MTKPAGFSVLTSCKTVEDFIDEYGMLSTKDSIFVPHVDPQLFGLPCAFAILLANHQVVLAGTCVVRDVYTTTHNAYERQGMRLRVTRMGPESQQVWYALEAARELDAVPRAQVRVADGTRDVPQLADPGSHRRVEARAPSSPFILPANPFGDLTDASLEGIVDCRLYEDAARADRAMKKG